MHVILTCKILVCIAKSTHKENRGAKINAHISHFEDPGPQFARWRKHLLAFNQAVMIKTEKNASKSVSRKNNVPELKDVSIPVRVLTY